MSGCPQVLMNLWAAVRVNTGVFMCVCRSGVAVRVRRLVGWWGEREK